MNMVKKIFSLCLALTLLLSLAVPAMADDTGDHTNHTITINTSDLNRTYEAYQIFSGSVEFLDSDNDSKTDPVKVLTHITWGNAVDCNAVVKELNILQALQSPTRNPKSYQLYEKIKAAGVVVDGKARTWNDVAADIADALGKSNSEANGIHFSDVVGDYLINANGIKSGKVTVDGVEKLQIGSLSDGYYLVRDTTSLANSNEVRSLFMMQLVENSTATPKPSTVEIKKFIANGDERLPYLAESSGDAVDFVLRGTVPTRIYSYPAFYYAIEDTMVSGFDLVQDSIKVFVYNGSQFKQIADNDIGDNKICKITPDTTAKTIKVEFPDLKKLEESNNYTLQGSSYIVVTYQARLNKDATVGSTGNENKVLLRFSDGPHSDNTRETNKEYVDVFTFGLNIEKIDGSNSKKLQGAEFVLYRERGGKHQHALIKEGWVYEWTEEEYDTLKASIETQADATEKQKLQEKLTAMTLTSDVNGKVTINGLAEDTYYLKEVKAPYGYQLLKDPYQFQIDAEYEENVKNADSTITRVKLSKLDLIPAGGTRVSGDAGAGMVNVSIVNNPGHTLPETGGIGTTIFYVVGGILAAGALVLLITRKRMYE